MPEINDFKIFRYINEDYSQYYISYFLGKEKKLMVVGEVEALKLKQFEKNKGISLKKDNQK